MRKMSYGALTSSFIIIPSLMLCLSVCQSVRASPSVSFSALDYTEAVQRSERIFLPSPLWVLRARQSSTLMTSPILGFGELLIHQVREREGRGEGGQKRPKGVDKDLFVPEWWPILPGHCPGQLLGVRHFSTAARCWDVEGWCGERASYWVTGIWEGWPGLLAWGIWRAIKRPTAHIFPPLPPRQCQLCIIGEWQLPSQQHRNAYWFIKAKHAKTTTIIVLSKWKTTLPIQNVTSGHIWSR